MVDNNTPSPTNITWMPTVSGVISLFAGVLNLVTVIFLVVAIIMTWSPGDAQIEVGMLASFWLLITGMLGVIGGIYSLRHDRWGLALAGSIASIPTPMFNLGVIATVFVAISRQAFSR